MLKRQMYGRAGSALLQKLEQSLGVDACLNLWQVKTSVMYLRRTEDVITVRYPVFRQRCCHHLGPGFCGASPAHT